MKTKKIARKKLTLNKETIALLADVQLKAVYGGITPNTRCGPQYPSECVCEETGPGCDI